MIIWYLSDGKPGHLNQVLGLLEALERNIQLETHKISVSEVEAGFFTWLSGKVQTPQKIPLPDLIIGVGHGTHWLLLALGRKTKAKTLVLMRPSLPLALFDYVCAPKHDRLPLKKNYLSSEGAINRIKPAEKIAKSGMILIGGPSSHATWSTHSIIEQLNELLEISSDVNWTVTTSRRTPEDFIEKIKTRMNLKIEPWRLDESNWLPKKISQTEQIWVTPDSVSMIYEALTAQAKVGIFQLQIIPTRVSMGIEQLLNDNIIVDFNSWKMNKKWQLKNSQLNEAERCASWLLKQMSQDK